MRIKTKIINSKTRFLYKLLEHAAFWLTYFVLYIIYCNYNYNFEFSDLIRDNLVYISIDILISYLIITFTDKTLAKKRYFSLLVYWLMSLGIGILIYRVVFVYIIAAMFYHSHIQSFWDFNLLKYTYGLFFPVAMINIIHLIRKWVHSQREMYEIAKAKIDHELSFLKIQLNQHFLFNTLNNIDSLIYSDPESASQTIVNLSNLLRYSIYETNVRRVPVNKEINYITNFIELYELRLIKSDKIELKICGEYESLLIVPRLFIPFVENALIYGKKDDDSKIYISITFVNNKVTLCTMNQIKQMEYDKQGGVGISNVVRTLDLVYSQKYNLEMTNRDNWYTVKLTIELDNGENGEN